MLTIDGSLGEGGGQVLRTALSLSAITGTPFRIHRIRAGRQKPGLARQHLTCVRAAAAVCRARVQGDALRSTEVVFRPGAVRPGPYDFAIGTAGSTGLVLQTVLPPLMLARAPSTVTLTGGTHNPKAPPTHFLQQTFLPLLRRMGPRVDLELRSWGFSPAGGGEVRAAIEPVAQLSPLQLLDRGTLNAIRGLAVSSGIPNHVVRREADALAAALELSVDAVRCHTIEDPAGPGNAVLGVVESDALTEVFTAFGERRLRAEAVAQRVAEQVRAYLEAQVPVGLHLADQLLLPMALAGRGVYRTVAPDPHTTTNVEVIRAFLDVPIAVEREDEVVWRVVVGE